MINRQFQQEVDSWIKELDDRLENVEMGMGKVFQEEECIHEIYQLYFTLKNELVDFKREIQEVKLLLMLLVKQKAV